MPRASDDAGLAEQHTQARALAAQQGRAAEALPLFRAVIDGRTAQLGAEHPETAAAIRDFQFCLAGLGSATPAAAAQGRVEEVGGDDDDEDGDQEADAGPGRPARVPQAAADRVVRYTNTSAQWLSCFFLVLLVAPACMAVLLTLEEAVESGPAHDACVSIGLCRSFTQQLQDIYLSTNQGGKTLAKVEKIPRLLRKWRGREAKLVAEVAAKYGADMQTDFSSARHVLRALCPLPVSAVGGAQRAEAAGLTVAVVATIGAAYMCCGGGGAQGSGLIDENGDDFEEEGEEEEEEKEEEEDGSDAEEKEIK